MVYKVELFVWLVADGWCWFVLREKYADGWFVLREKYCWLVADSWFVLREKYWWLISQTNRVMFGFVR
jgi:hypothetical protein